MIQTDKHLKNDEDGRGQGFLEKIQISSDNRNTPKENIRIRENFDRLNSIAKF